jgi:catechol 2,3-dioxygenase-like lactoylglutathione lyase family enzyme
MAAPAEPLHDIAHLGSVELFTPKPEKSLWYFRDLLGMEPVHESGPSVYLRGYGDYATSTLKLTAGRPMPASAASPGARPARRRWTAMSRRLKPPASGSAGAMAISAAAARSVSAIPTATSWKFIMRSRNSSRRRNCIQR